MGLKQEQIQSASQRARQDFYSGGSSVQKQPIDEEAQETQAPTGNKIPVLQMLQDGLSEQEINANVQKYKQAGHYVDPIDLDKYKVMAQQKRVQDERGAEGSKSFLDKIKEAWSGRVDKVATGYGRTLKLGKGELDPALRAQLEKRGMDDKIKQLEALNVKTGLGTATLNLAGQAVGLGTDIGMAGLGSAIKTVTPKFIEEGVKENINDILGSELGQSALLAIQGGAEKYAAFKELHPIAAQNLEAVGNIASVIPIGKGGQIVGKSLSSQISKKTITEAGATLGRIGQKGIDKIKRKEIGLLSQKYTMEDLVGQIAQGETKDIPVFSRALSEVDVSDIKTYSDLEIRFNDKVGSLSRQVDARLEADNRILSVDDLAVKQIVGGQRIQTNFVSKALDHLDEMYKKTEAPVDIERVKQLRAKLDGQGLSLLEVNNLAREYGMKKSGFNLSGTPSTSVTKQGYENVRKGLKQTTRDLMPDKTTQILDEKITDLISARELSRDMVEKVNKLNQRVKNRNIVEKLSKGAVDVFNIITLGGPRQILFSLMGLRNQGFKTLNALDLEEQLPKLLKNIEKINNAKTDKTIIKELEQMAKDLKIK